MSHHEPPRHAPTGRRHSAVVYRRRRLAVTLSLVGGLVVIVLVAFGVVNLWGGTQPAPTPTPTKSVTPTPTPTPTPTFDKTLYSIDDPMSLWVVVNKHRPLPSDFVPSDLVDANVDAVFSSTLREPAARAVEQMFAAYNAETGDTMRIQSAFRDYQTQIEVYDNNNHDDTQSARPGFSEHQTGLTLDISPLSGECALDECFANTQAGQWLAANAWKYGFMLRYPQGLTNIEGYAFEPWHYRYVGPELATELHNTGIQTLEEFFGLEPAPDYLP